MPNKYHNTGGSEPQSRGLKARELQLVEAVTEAREARGLSREVRPGMGITGTVANDRQVQISQRALERQRRYAAGKYPVK